MKHSGRAAVAMVTAAVLTVAATACSEPDERRGLDEVVVAYPSDVDTLDPHQFRSIAAYGVVGNIYGTLLQEDYAEPKDGVLEYTGKSTPYLAKSATWNTDKTKLTMVLRPGLTFSDGGDVSAEDVVYSLRRALSDVGYASQIGSWLNIDDTDKDIVARGGDTVEITVTHYSPLIEQFLTFQIFPVLDSAAVEAKATKKDPWSAAFLAKKATASGPYVVDSETDGQGVTLVKNPKYTATDISDAPDRVVVKNMPDLQQAFLALQNQAVDVVSGLTPDVAQAVERDDDLKLYDLAYSDVVYLGMNNKDPVLKDVRVRRAISHLIPYEALREDVMKGYAGAAYGAVPYPMQDALDTKGDRDAYATDTAAAKRLLAEAGVDAGDLSLTMSVPASDTVLRESAVFIQSALKEAGIAVKVDVMSDADYNSNLGKLQMYVDSWYSWGQDSVFQLFFLLKSGVFTNYTNFSNKDVDRLLARAMATTDAEERRRLSQQAQRIVIEQAPWAFMFTRNMLIGAQADVTGITHSNDANLRFDRLRVGR